MIGKTSMAAAGLFLVKHTLHINANSFRWMFDSSACACCLSTDRFTRENPSAMNKIVKMIHKDRQLRNQIIAACEQDGNPLTRQAINDWKNLPNGVPVKRVKTVARVTGLGRHTIRPDIFPRGT